MQRHNQDRNGLQLLRPPNRKGSNLDHMAKARLISLSGVSILLCTKSHVKNLCADFFECLIYVSSRLVYFFLKYPLSFLSIIGTFLKIYLLFHKKILSG